MAIIYGRFTHEEYEARGDDPYIVHSNNVYRITEVHETRVCVQYQAVEVVGREPAVEELPIDPPVNEDARARDDTQTAWTVPADPAQPPDWSPPKLSLSEFARDRG